MPAPIPFLPALAAEHLSMNLPEQLAVPTVPLHSEPQGVNLSSDAAIQLKAYRRPQYTGLLSAFQADSKMRVQIEERKLQLEENKLEATQQREASLLAFEQRRHNDAIKKDLLLGAMWQGKTAQDALQAFQLRGHVDVDVFCLSLNACGDELMNILKPHICRLLHHIVLDHSCSTPLRIAWEILRQSYLSAKLVQKTPSGFELAADLLDFHFNLRVSDVVGGYPAEIGRLRQNNKHRSLA
ncbi:hypothetical protein RI367_008347 [Sorochytrium milnesiophthora]